MTRVEMDDVLSSIRRLVSDKKPEKTASSGGHSGLLLLTPAQRVDPDTGGADTADDSDKLLAGGPERVAAASPTQAAPRRDAPPAAGPGKTGRASLESRIAELERAVVSSDEQWEPDGSEPGSLHEPDLHVLEQYRERFTSLRLSDVAPVGENAGDTAPVEPEAVENRVAEPLGPVADRQARPAVPELHDPARAERSEPPAADLSEPSPEQVGEGRPDGDGAPGVEPQPPLQLADVAIFSHAPRGQGAMPPTRPAEQPAPAPVEQPASAPAETAPTDVIDADDDVFVDEELLRQVVSEIVRDELQGRLGERITRNVRRMVRQEIERALALKSIK